MNQIHKRGVTYEFNHSKEISEKTVKTQIVPLQHDNVQQETNVITARIITTFRGDRPWQ